jgi:hypothetical protein
MFYCLQCFVILHSIEWYYMTLYILVNIVHMLV